MSIRRKAGDVVRKRENAGFVGEPLMIKLLPYETECLWKDGQMHPDEPEPCMLEHQKDSDQHWPDKDNADTCTGCHDPECVEWANCEVVGKWNADGALIPINDGYCVYHVGECEMESIEPL